MVALLRYVFDHNQQVIAGLVVIILLTAIMLFLRAIGQEKGATVGAGGASAHLDIGAIETALKRVMAASGGVVGSAANETPSGADALGEAKVQELAREIDRLTSELATKSQPGAPVGEADPAKLAELQAKLDELQGKLMEYEIIEDDIADLSRFKEENAELKSELESLRKAASAMPVAPVPTVSATVTEAVVEVAAPAPPPVVAAAPAPVPIVAPPPDPDEALKDFASSMQIQDGSSVLDGSLDTEKMLSEVADLAAAVPGADDEDALSGTLDTDKLLAEVDTMAPGAAAAAASVAVAAPTPAAVVTPPAAAAPVAESPESNFEDDLLAEFKETNDGGQG